VTKKQKALPNPARHLYKQNQLKTYFSAKVIPLLGLLNPKLNKKRKAFFKRCQ
jgi:light-regulated signal transduction histidine kinase (bacteriophytochrome)